MCSRAERSMTSVASGCRHLPSGRTMGWRLMYCRTDLMGHSNCEPASAAARYRGANVCPRRPGRQGGSFEVAERRLGGEIRIAMAVHRPVAKPPMHRAIERDQDHRRPLGLPTTANRSTPPLAGLPPLPHSSLAACLAAAAMSANPVGWSMGRLPTVHDSR